MRLVDGILTLYLLLGLQNCARLGQGLLMSLAWT